MRKFLILAGIIVVLIIIIFFTALIISFKFVKQTTDNINLDLKNKFTQIVKIPNEISPSYRGYTTTVYNWEMETNQKEYIRVIFKHDTGFSQNNETIRAILEMDEAGDPSIFNKVLPAVIADKESLYLAQHVGEPPPQQNPQIGYSKVEILPHKNNQAQISKISWEFNREDIRKESQENYERLNNYPEALVKFLHSFQRAIIIILSP